MKKDILLKAMFLTFVCVLMAACLKNEFIYPPKTNIMDTRRSRGLSRTAFVVDKQTLETVSVSTIYEQTEAVIPVGRTLPVYLKQVLQKHFSEVEIFGSEKAIPEGKFDVTVKVEKIEIVPDFYIGFPPLHTTDMTINLTVKINKSGQLFPKRISALIAEKAVGPSENLRYRVYKRLSGIAMQQVLAGFSRSLSGSYMFGKNDFKNLNKFVVQSKNSGNPVSVYLFQKFSKDLQEAIDGVARLVEEETAVALISELNKLLMGDVLYDKKTFEKTELSMKTKELLEGSSGNALDGNKKVSLNRFLLEDAFPNLIEKCDLTLHEAVCRRD